MKSKSKGKSVIAVVILIAFILLVVTLTSGKVGAFDAGSDFVSFPYSDSVTISLSLGRHRDGGLVSNEKEV